MCENKSATRLSCILRSHNLDETLADGNKGFPSIRANKKAAKKVLSTGRNLVGSPSTTTSKPKETTHPIHHSEVEKRVSLDARCGASRLKSLNHWYRRQTKQDRNSHTKRTKNTAPMSRSHQEVNVVVVTTQHGEKNGINAFGTDFKNIFELDPSIYSNPS